MRTLTTLVAGIVLALTLAAPQPLPALEKPAEQTTKKAPGRGDVPPPALGNTRDGDQIATTQFAGKVLVVTFWASWCGPCLAELPIMEGLKKAGKGQIEVVAVNIEDRDKFRLIARRLATLSLTLTHDGSKQHREAYGVNGIPHMVIIGKDGKIRNVHRGYSEKALDGFVAEINAALAAG